MSTDVLIFIPVEPIHRPEAALGEQARKLLKVLIPEVQEISTQITDEVEFIATGGNLESITCHFVALHWTSNGGVLQWTLHTRRPGLQVLA